MQDLWFSLNTVFPLLVMMGAGYGARRLRWISEAAIREANNCVYRVFLPLLLCFNIADTALGSAVDGRTLLFAFAGTMLCFLVMFLIAPRICERRIAMGVVVQGVARSNYAIFGIPLVLMMYPEADTSVAALMIVVVVPVFNVMSTAALMIYSQEALDWKRMLKGFLFNPLILGTAAGFLLWRFQLSLPGLLEGPLRGLGSITTPLSLFLLGASLDFQKARANMRLLFVTVIGRLILVPLVFLPIAGLMGIRDVSMATLIAVFASPVAVSSYPMAQQIGGDEDLAGAHVVFSTAFSIVTVFFWVFALKAVGFLS